MLRFVPAGRSHRGLVRRNNEDAGFVGSTCLVVADGVGGSPAGEVASATAAHVVSSNARQRVGLRPVSVLRGAVQSAHLAISEGVARRPDWEGMATTLTAVLTDGQRVGLVHVGDSRAYLFREGNFRQLTNDHTWAGELLALGDLTAEEARHHPYRNVVVRSLHGDSDEAGDLIDLRLRPGDRLLLTTDGVTDLVDDEMLTTVLDRTDDDEVAVAAIEAAALRLGGRDNITVVVATVAEASRSGSQAGTPLGAACDRLNILDVDDRSWGALA